MLKSIIATTLSGLVIQSSPWKKSHILWYENAAKKLKDPSVKEWIGKDNYWPGVDDVMRRLYPQLNDKERDVKARETFFDAVCQYIRKHPEIKNEEVIKYLKTLKSSYRLALITTNTQEALNQIFKASKLENLFDITETSRPEEKDDKRAVFLRFVKKYGKPLVYVGGDRKDSYDFCRENKIPHIFANLEIQEEIPGVRSVHDLVELKHVISRLV